MVNRSTISGCSRLAACLPLHLSVHLFVHPSILTSICCHVSPNIHPSTCQSIQSTGYWNNFVSLLHVHLYILSWTVKRGHNNRYNNIWIWIICSFWLWNQSNPQKYKVEITFSRLIPIFQSKIISAIFVFCIYLFKKEFANVGCCSKFVSLVLRIRLLLV